MEPAIRLALVLAFVTSINITGYVDHIVSAVVGRH